MKRNTALFDATMLAIVFCAILVGFRSCQSAEFEFWNLQPVSSPGPKPWKYHESYQPPARYADALRGLQACFGQPDRALVISVGMDAETEARLNREAKANRNWFVALPLNFQFCSNGVCRTYGRRGVFRIMPTEFGGWGRWEQIAKQPRVAPIEHRIVRQPAIRQPVYSMPARSFSSFYPTMSRGFGGGFGASCAT